jgi:hypothetical protein
MGKGMNRTPDGICGGGGEGKTGEMEDTGKGHSGPEALARILSLVKNTRICFYWGPSIEGAFLLSKV